MNIMCYYSPIEGPNPSPKATIDPIKPKALPCFSCNISSYNHHNQ